MAYLLDNENLFTQGDPLEELDRELAELKASIHELDSLMTSADADHPEQTEQSENR